ncbi:MAG: class I SAM-dependent methyltransferase [Actinomycetota bacterium]|nr:class I SAM-dependent methyltransferase [Actinomycetota bacterium]
MSSDPIGAVAPDGSPVELYALLPPLGEAELVHAAIPPRSRILELGCGAGRITRGLVALGHRVVAVDESADMLAHVQGAETVHSRIEELDLARRFDAVVLAGNLINVDSEDARQAFLDACRRHVADGGVIVIQRLPLRDDAWHERTSAIGPVRTTLRDVARSGAVVSAVVEYEAGERRWRHRFTSRLIDDDELDAALAGARLRRRDWLDDRHLWLTAEPTK